MKHVIFNTVRIQNFLSIGEDELLLNFKKGVTLISGNNRDKGGKNGVGKSSVIEALFWGLFGQTIREIKKSSQIINNQTKENCNVEICFSVLKNSIKHDYRIIRSLEPNKVHLFKDGENITRSSMPKTDDLIAEIIGANSEVFQNAVIMSINSTTPFMAQKKVDKRKFVEGVLNLGIFGEMLLEIRQEHNDIKKELEVKGNELNSFIKRQNTYKENEEETNKTKLDKINKLQSKIEINNSKIQELSSLKDISSKILKLKEKLSSLEKNENILNTKLIECSNKTVSINNKLQQLNFELKNLQKSKANTLKDTEECPTCKRKYSDSEKHNFELCLTDLEEQIKICKKTITEENEDLNQQQGKCDKISEGLSVIAKEYKKINALLSEYNVSSISVQNLLDRNKEIETEIKEIENEKNNFSTLIENIDTQIIESTAGIKNLQIKNSIIESSKFVVSEEGVKTLIVKEMLNLLNSRLNFYLRALEAPCKCIFNESFEEELHNDLGIECSYFNFSNGERRRIDLAILFMFQDLLRIQTGTSFSVSIYDELLDSAIDDKGIIKVTSILKDRVEKYGESIYIVSHSKLASHFGIDYTIELEKVNGCTKIITQHE